MSIESLKEKARRHEQREDWAKALDLYLQAIRSVDPDEDDEDVGLYNRVGDLEVRLGRIDAAVDHYEQAADLYVAAELPNNAIAICKKVIRNVPGRDSIYLKMGQIRAHQGFVTDARQSFLTYAERKQAAGDLEEAFRALVEFVELVPDDTDTRMALAAQLAQHERVEEAVEQFAEARRRLILEGEDEEAEAVAARIRELAPDADLPDPAAVRAAGDTEAAGAGLTDAGWGGGFSDFALAEDEPPDSGKEAAAAPAPGPMAGSGVGEEEEEDEIDVGGFDIAGEADEAEADEEEPEEEEVAPLPGLDEPLPGFDAEDQEEEDEPEALPGFDEPLPGIDEPVPAAGAEEEDRPAGAGAEEREGALEEAAFEEAVFETAVEGEDEAETDMEPSSAPAEERSPESFREEGERLLEEGRADEAWPLLEKAHEALARRGDARDAAEVVRRMTEERPDELALHQRVVEYAYRAFDDDLLSGAYLGLGDALRRSGQVGKAETAYRQALDHDPESEAAEAALAQLAGAQPARPESRPEVASSEEYVDLGAMILDDEGEEKSTRFVVAAEAPSGDEAADFAKMLTQFKEKVAENVDTDDVAAHYDLGTAYKEMGLVDEAIGEFQSALRAARDHLPTYEMLGQCFLEKGESETALKTLERALAGSFEVEDELLGIYYYLGRANEALGRTEGAVEYYDKVFALDINFMDVTERLRNLR